MKTKTFVLLTGLAALAWAHTRCVDAPQNDNVDTAIPVATPSPSDSTSLIARGEYLVTIMGCDDCHSPKKMGPHGPEIIPELRLSGYPAERPVAEVDANALRQGGAFMNSDLTSATGPWGTSFAGNISSDATGIGQWTEAQFKKALTQGKYKGLDGGRILLPPMPWPNYSRLTDEDIRAIYLFLQSTRPVKNVVPAPRPPASMATR
ncbi:c-type cytochrome [Catalinimonas sp. 4WD22]|uniref:c-type cytochrome n=1 Tax=Catalinimonas locisalis TaxID=3133978 RepID=UPI0031019883